MVSGKKISEKRVSRKISCDSSEKLGFIFKKKFGSDKIVISTSMTKG